MRCKNCGTENDDNRYICENCGSPLYDEADIEKLQNSKQQQSAAESSGATRTFKAVGGTPQKPTTQPQAAPPARTPAPAPAQEKAENRTAEKKSVIVIAVLAVVLIAVIASVIAIASGNREDAESESESLTKISTTAEDETTTRRQTTEATTERTTESTTERTTTTTQRLWIINASSSGGGTVSGDGEYENGEEVTLTATADSGYVFDGWYANGIKVSGDSSYTFTANENASFSAVFNPVTTETTTAPADTTVGETSGADVAFG